MEIVINTSEPLSDIERQVLAVLTGTENTVEETTPAPAAQVMKEEAAVASKKATAKKAAPKPEPEPMAEEPLDEDEEEDDEVEEDEAEEDEEVSDEDLLALAVKKATEMVGSGGASKVREALDAAGASRVRELNASNVREFFKALS